MFNGISEQQSHESKFLFSSTMVCSRYSANVTFFRLSEYENRDRRYDKEVDKKNISQRYKKVFDYIFRIRFIFFFVNCKTFNKGYICIYLFSKNIKLLA